MYSTVWNVQGMKITIKSRYGHTFGTSNICAFNEIVSPVLSTKWSPKNSGGGSNVASSTVASSSLLQSMSLSTSNCSALMMVALSMSLRTAAYLLCILSFPPLPSIVC